MQTMTVDQLIREIDAQRSLMISVATSKLRIETVNGQFKERQEQIQHALEGLGLRDPNPFNDLWEWYGKWSSGDLPTWQSRRQYVADLYNPLVERLKRRPVPTTADFPDEPTGWNRVDRGIDQIRKQLEEASGEEQFQAVGLYCRETMISLAQVVYDPKKHPPTDDTTPSKTDGKRMLDAYLAAELGGHSNEVARKYAKAALDFANELQHKRTAAFREAALCAEAMRAVVNLIAIISGRRDSS